MTEYVKHLMARILRPARTCKVPVLSSRRGQTLAEALMALVVATMSVVAIITVIFSSLYSERRADQKMEANAKVQEVVEKLKRYLSVDMEKIPLTDLCGGSEDVFSTVEHDVSCLLDPNSKIIDNSMATLTYTVGTTPCGGTDCSKGSCTTIYSCKNIDVHMEYKVDNDKR